MLIEDLHHLRSIVKLFLAKTWEVWPSGLRYWFAKSVRREGKEYNMVKTLPARSIAVLYSGAAIEQSLQ